MRSLRERPRLVAARVLGVALLVGIGVAIGALVDDPSSEIPAGTQAQLKRAETLNHKRPERLDLAEATAGSLRAELDDAMKRARTLTRGNARLRRELRGVKRELRRAQRARRARPR